MTLSQYLEDRRSDLKSLREPGFARLEVKASSGYLLEIFHARVLYIFTVDAIEPGAGCFTRLMEELHAEYPSMAIVVCAVETDRFAEGLERRGFVRSNELILGGADRDYIWVSKSLRSSRKD